MTPLFWDSPLEWDTPLVWDGVSVALVPGAQHVAMSIAERYTAAVEMKPQYRSSLAVAERYAATTEVLP